MFVFCVCDDPMAGAGMGYGFMFGTSMVSVSQYFLKRRSLANGLAVSGGSIGQLVLPQFLRFVLAEYGFQGALLIYAGLVLNAIPGALLLRPPEHYKRGMKAAQLRRAMAEEQRAKEERDLKLHRRLDRRSFVEIGDSQWRKGSPDEDAGSLELVHLHQTSVVEEVLYIDRGTQTMPPPEKPSVGAILWLIITRLFDKKLLTNTVFLLLVTALSLGHGGYLDILFLLPAYCLELFDNKEVGALILSIMGVADLAGRIFGGWFSDLGLIKRPYVIGFSFTMCGAISILMPIQPSYPVFITYTVVYGLLGGTYMALMAVII